MLQRSQARTAGAKSAASPEEVAAGRPLRLTPIWRRSPPLLAGALVFAMAFGLFAATTSQSLGYDPETGAVAEGLVRGGALREIGGSPLESEGVPGRAGNFYSRAGILQPFLEAPFYAVGWGWDEVASSGKSYNHRQLLLMFYNPLVAALAAVALFALVYLTRRSLGWAAAIAALFTFSSIAWPYAKIGMETTLMFVVLASLALAAYARERPSFLIWLAAGTVAGAASATKAWGALVPLAAAAMLASAFMRLNRKSQIKLAAAFLIPVAAWLAVDAWYNWWRFGTFAGDGGYSSRQIVLGAMVSLVALGILALAVHAFRRRRAWFWAVAIVSLIGAIAMRPDTVVGVAGVLASPGKGLVFYSPLIALGIMGIPRMWRHDRSATGAVLLLLALVTILAGGSHFWGDETWGPRFLVPVAGLLLVPLAWWASTQTRVNVLLAVAALSALVQIIAVSVRYDRYYSVAATLTGKPVYGPRTAGLDPATIPYGDDPPRWIPELSPLVVQAEGLLSAQLIEPVTGKGLKVTYAPYEGQRNTVDLSDPDVKSELDFWWHRPYDGLTSRLAALALLVTSAASAVGLFRLVKRPRTY